MNIRRAERKDADRINALLFQIAELHANGRPDIFKSGEKKYTDDELFGILENDETPVFVATDDSDFVIGYAFCIYRETKGDVLLSDMKTLYIDDLCVDESYRGGGIGKALFDFVRNEAKKTGCYNLTLNVWSFNESAARFYEKCGLKPMKTVMEELL